MNILTYTVHGAPAVSADLTKDDYGTLYLDQQAVLAVTQWGRLVALTLVNKLVLVQVADYARLVPHCGMLSVRQRST